MTDLKIIFLNVKGLNNVVKTHTHTHKKNSFILKKGKKQKLNCSTIRNSSKQFGTLKKVEKEKRSVRPYSSAFNHRKSYKTQQRTLHSYLENLFL